jgi:hypothetical protein
MSRGASSLPDPLRRSASPTAWALVLLAACAAPADSAPTEDDTAAEDSPPIEETPATTCADPTARDTLGPMYESDLGPDWAVQQPAGWEGEYNVGDALGVEDLNGDGRLDVLVVDWSALLLYIATEDGSWREESALRLPNLAGGSGSGAFGTVAVVDIDGDDDLDLYLGRNSKPHALLLNDGTGVFSDASEGVGLPTGDERVRTTPFGDMDGDGDLDLFVGHDGSGTSPPDPGAPNALYENLGNGTFRDVTDRLTEPDIYGYTRGGGWYDVDADGDQDLYIVNHKPSYAGNQLLFNQGDGTFVHDPDAGADVRLSGMGLGVADLNEDRFPDMLLSGWDELQLLQSLDGPIWADTALARGLQSDPDTDRVVAWGNDLADFDLDGRVDAFVLFGMGSSDDADDTIQENPAEQPDGLWLQQEDGSFVQVADEWGVADVGSGRAVAAVDIDDDGWLDLITKGRGEPAVLHRARCGDATWLRVRLRGLPPNTRGVGARVTVEAGGREQTRWIGAMSSSLNTSMPFEAHFGLGDAERATITVRWPDGEEATVSDVTTRQTVTVTEE